MTDNLRLVLMLLPFLSGCSNGDNMLTKQQKCTEIASDLQHTKPPHTHAHHSNNYNLDRVQLMNQWHSNNCQEVLYGDKT